MREKKKLHSRHCHLIQPLAVEGGGVRRRQAPHRTVGRTIDITEANENNERALNIAICTHELKRLSTIFQRHLKHSEVTFVTWKKQHERGSIRHFFRPHEKWRVPILAGKNKTCRFSLTDNATVVRGSSRDIDISVVVNHDSRGFVVGDGSELKVPLELLVVGVEVRGNLEHPHVVPHLVKHKAAK